MNIEKTKSYDKMCIFDKNSITEPKQDSLNNHDCSFYDTNFYKPCSCSFGWIRELSKQDLKKSSFCRVEDLMARCLNSTIFNIYEYDIQTCRNNSKIVDCIAMQKKKPISNPSFINPNILERESKHDIFTYIYIGIIAVTIIFALLISVLTVRRYCKGKNRSPQVTISEGQSNQNTISQMKNSKSFSHDDRRIINQTLKIMLQKHTREQYDQVYNNTKKLLEGNLTETEKVRTIGDIVQTIEECQNAGEDFVAFTGILYNHLASKDGNQNDPVYAEPMMLQDARIADEDGQTILDHIYAEPSSVQQPLLTNEYATPLDRRNESVYSEPVLNERGEIHFNI